MSLSFGKLLLILLIVLLIFGAGKLPRVMNDLGKGIRSLREGMNSDDDEDAPKDKNASPKQLTSTTRQEAAREQDHDHHR